jgi:hypothetical protein
VRNWSRLARIWRQVMARASRVLRSICEAMEMMILVSWLVSRSSQENCNNEDPMLWIEETELTDSIPMPA